MEFQGAVMTEQGLKFAVVIVQEIILIDKNKADSTIKSFKPVFPGMPVILMAQDPLGNPSYYGRKDISEFLSGQDVDDIPWKNYSY